MFELEFTGQYEAIPERMRRSIIRYVKEGIPMGDFLTAVVCNDLKCAVGYADEENLPLLKIYVQWFHNVCPAIYSGKENYLKHTKKV
jgi:hypothetical protein